MWKTLLSLPNLYRLYSLLFEQSFLTKRLHVNCGLPQSQFNPQRPDFGPLWEKNPKKLNDKKKWRWELVL